MKYPFVIQRNDSGYLGFFTDLPGSASAATKDELQERMEYVLATALFELRKSAERPPRPTPASKIDFARYQLCREEVEIGLAEPARMNQVSFEVARAIRQSGLSQAEVARRMGVPKEVVSRLADPFYFGHTLINLHRVAQALGWELRVSIQPRSPILREPY